MEPTNLAEEVSSLHAELCSALADPTRIMLIYALSERPSNVGELASQVGVSQPTASRHLKILRDRGLVKSTRLGPNVEYSLIDHRLEALIIRDPVTDRISQASKTE
jgi:ArsR family transcriptional regulator